MVESRGATSPEIRRQRRALVQASLPNAAATLVCDDLVSSDMAKSLNSKKGRISISLSSWCGLGERFTHSMHSSSDFVWRIQYPATRSLVSAKGPSIT